MTKIVISEDIKCDLTDFLEDNPRSELVNAYLYFVERRFDLAPVAFPRGKMIFQSVDSAVLHLEKENELWRETQVKISVGTQAVNDLTKKIYICPFTGKVYGDNTHPNPQDAIYDWVSKCPENTERSDGLRIKRFFVSEDPEIIKNYIKPKKSITKVVYSSAITGKLFQTKASVLEDFRNNHVKKMTLAEIQSQNRFEIETKFLDFLQTQLDESKITAFVEALAEHKEFLPSVGRWVEDEAEE
ncbi:MAG: hypothetical protein ACI9S8_000232 [Chlamydiales bacterium]|jgi:hypothetical protein